MPKKSAIDFGTTAGAKKSPLFPSAFAPMLASLPDGPLGKPGTWLFEPKLDGIRCIALINNGVATLLSRRGLDLTSQYPGLAAALPSCVSVPSCILDGEIIALNAAGRPSFQHLQQRMNLTKSADIQRAEVAVPAHFFVFDITRAGDYDLTPCKLVDRKAVLEQVLKPSTTERIHLTPSFDCEGTLAYEVCIENGFEGIVAKRSQSPYEVGRRSPYWHKVKAQQTGEFVIGGYSMGEGSRASTFGALLLGYFDSDGKLLYCGSVGTGFDDKLLAETMRRLKPHVVPKTQFKNPPKDKKGCVWTAPNVVAEIKYMDITRDGHLRTPVFLHFRQDKAPSDVTYIESPVAIPMVAEKTADTIYDRVLGQLSGEAVEMELIVGSEKIKLTSLNKELWPNVKKRDYLRCLTQMAPYLLPHWQNRPITLIRSPFGVRGKFFFQKHWHTALPEFVETLSLPDKDEYLLCNNLASLLFFAQHGVLEFHTFSSRTSLQPDPPPGATPSTSMAELLSHPDYIVFDLDYHLKSNKEKSDLDLDAYKRARDVAFALYEYLNAAKLNSYVKLSGKNGLHVFVPVKREFDFSATRTLAETVAKFLVSQRPNEVSIDFEVKKRENRVYLDCGQNGAGRTIAAPYTPRAVSWGSVSTPVTWKELANVTPLDFTLYTMATRLASVGDIWVDILTRKNDLAAAVSKGNPK